MGNLDHFEGKQIRDKISETREARPTKIGFCAFHVNLFLSYFPSHFCLSTGTFDVTNATVAGRGPGYVCVLCSFIPYTPARGCHVNLTRITTIIDTAELIVSADISRSQGRGCINVSLSGEYYLTVHDWNDDNDYSLVPAFNLSTLYIPQPVIGSIPTTSAIQPTPTNSGLTQAGKRN